MENENVVCSVCGNTIHNDNYTIIEEEVVCTDCSEHITYCEHCGKTIDDRDDETHCYDGNYYCDDCYNELFNVCRSCGNTIPTDDCNWYDDEPYCRDCYENNFCTCNNCGDVIQRDYAYVYDDKTYCEDCYNDNFCECYNCGDTIRRDYAYVYDEEYYCEDCYNNVDIIHGYHHRDLEIEYKQVNSDDLNWYLGFELEVEKDRGSRFNNQQMAQYIRQNYPELGLVFETDGSLSTGFEIISQPMTINYIYKHSEDFKGILKALQDNGFKSHDTSTCGLHIHVSRTILGEGTNATKNLNKLILFTETFKDEIKRFSRRDNYGYCKFTSDTRGLKNKTYYKSSEILKRLNDMGSRYQVVNTTNNNTIEIRVFRGTLKYETFMATLEFVYNMFKCITEVPTRKINFNKVIKYTDTLYLQDYCAEKEIYNSTYMSDETSNIKKNLTKKVDNTNKIIDTYNDCINQSIVKIVDTLDKMTDKNKIQKELLIDKKNDTSLYMSLYTDLARLNDRKTTKVDISNDDLLDSIIKLDNIDINDFISTLTRFINDLKETLKYSCIYVDENKDLLSKLCEELDKIQENLKENTQENRGSEE
ncbi:MAG: amidoligase family protein [Clostridia bacterium]|nr:amidoligase family protein [Clostridia bacterium]